MDIDSFIKDYDAGYYDRLVDEINLDEYFLEICKKGRLDIVQWLYSLNKHYNIYHGFKYSCRYGHRNIAQWIYDLNIMDINTNIELYNEAFIESCKYGQLGIAQWLYELKSSINLDIHINNDDAIKSSCTNGQLNIVQWMCSLNNDYQYPYPYPYSEMFAISCRYNAFHIAQWLYDMKYIDNQMINNAFHHCCINGKLESAKWIHNLVNGNIKIEPITIKLSCMHGYYNVVKWLSTICDDYEIIYENYKIKGYKNKKNDFLIVKQSDE